MPENSQQYQERLVTLRKQIKKQGLDGFILPRTDEFQNEFLAPYAERLAWLTGFTGSAGTAVILPTKAAIFSDSRYTIQLKNQVNSFLYNIENITENPVGKWIKENVNTGDNIGYDMWLYTAKQIKDIKEDLAGKDINLIPLKFNFIDDLWQGQPEKPSAPVTIFPNDVAGSTSLEKRNLLAKDLKKSALNACVISSCDSLCWLLNVRGGDVEYSPLVLSYGILYDSGDFDWFIDKKKLSAEVLSHIGQGVNIYSFDEILSQVKKVGGAIGLDPATCPLWFENHISNFREFKDPCILPKSIKSKAEQEAVRFAHINDGVALVKFLKWLDENNQQISELSLEAKLEEFRRENNDFIAPSFATIAGFAEHGAVVHYRATKESDKIVKGNSLLLLDSGGQYRWGTTDITRTIAIGEPSNEMIENYTRVLKGHIAVVLAQFKKGTVGADIDVLARKPLQEVGLDYGHGTGHGVGCYLCVHEAAAHISPRGEVAFKAGMLISNEPGYYKEGEYGIRIENLVLAQECDDNSNMLCFDTVTLVPFDPKLINIKMLDRREKQWLKTYTLDMQEKLAPYLSAEEKAWLEKVNSIYH